MADTPPPRKLEFADNFLIIAGVVMFFLIILLLAFDKIPSANMQLFTVVVSFVSGAWLGVVLTNRFGSSKGSDDKAAVISQLATRSTE